MLATVESSYGCDAEFYDRRTRAFQRDRLRIIDALPLEFGDVVLDVGCGTGLCFEGLRDRVGGSGVVIGIDQAPTMVSLSAGRHARHGWDDVTLVQAPVETAPIPVMADAALFSRYTMSCSRRPRWPTCSTISCGGVGRSGWRRGRARMDGHDGSRRFGHYLNPTFDRLMASTGPGLRSKSFVTNLGSTSSRWGGLRRGRPCALPRRGSPRTSPTAWPAIAPFTDRLAAIST